MADKYLLALKCLNAAAALDPAHPKIHEQAIRLRKTCKCPNFLTQASKQTNSDVVNDNKNLAEKVSTVIASSFNLIPASADLSALNDEFAKKHAQSAAHLQAVFSVRHFLDANTKSQNETGLTKLLDLEGTSTEHALSGLELLEECIETK